MSWVRLGFYFLLGMLISAMALEIALRFLPVTRGLFRTMETERWPLHAYTPHMKYTYSMTWDFQNANVGYTNNYGHLAPFEFVRGSKPIIVLGDSFIEAQMLKYSDTLQGQLQGFIQSKVPVYGLGISGNSIAEHLAVAELAKTEFQPRAAVIVMIDGDISESIGARSNHYFFEFAGEQPTLGYRSNKGVSISRRIREPVGDSALYRYLFANLKFSPGDIFNWMISTPAIAEQTAVRQKTQYQVAVADYFLRQFSVRSGIPAQCTVFLFDSDRAKLYDAQLPPAETKDPADLKQYFTETAQRFGYRVVDMKARFATNYQLHQQRFDFWPIDRHWNWLGHGLAGSEALAALRDSGNCL